MGNYRQIFYQIIFGTKHRRPTIDETHCSELYQYISGIIKNKNCKLYRINGVEDHIHIFSDLHPTVSLSDYIKDIKVATSIWMKASGIFPKFEAWQGGIWRIYLFPQGKRYDHQLREKPKRTSQERNILQ